MNLAKKTLSWALSLMIVLSGLVMSVPSAGAVVQDKTTASAALSGKYFIPINISEEDDPLGEMELLIYDQYFCFGSSLLMGTGTNEKVYFDDIHENSSAQDHVFVISGSTTNSGSIKIYSSQDDVNILLNNYNCELDLLSTPVWNFDTSRSDHYCNNVNIFLEGSNNLKYTRISSTYPDIISAKQLHVNFYSYDSTVSGSGVTNSSSNDSLTVKGNCTLGSLGVYGGNLTFENNVSIYDGDLKPYIKITGGKLNVAEFIMDGDGDGDTYTEFSISGGEAKFASGNITGSYTQTGGTVTISDKIDLASRSDFDLCADISDGTLSTSAIINTYKYTQTGGNVNITSGDSDTYSVLGDSDFTMTDGTLNISSKKNGISSGGKFSVSGGKLTVNAAKCALSNNLGQTSYLNAEFAGGIVKLSGSVGVLVYDDHNTEAPSADTHLVNIKGGNVQITSNNASYPVVYSNYVQSANSSEYKKYDVYNEAGNVVYPSVLKNITTADGTACKNVVLSGIKYGSASLYSGKAVMTDDQADLYLWLTSPAQTIKIGDDSYTCPSFVANPATLNVFTKEGSSSTESDTATGSDTTVDTTSDTGSDTTADTTSDTGSDTTSDTTSDTGSDTTSDTTSDTGSDTTADTTSDTGSDTTTDTTTDTASDTTTDTNTVQLTLVPNDGSLVVDGQTYTSAVTIDVIPGSVVELSTPVRNGYTFIGWNTSRDGTGVAFTGDMMSATVSNLTLYAIWQQNLVLKYGDADCNGEINMVDVTTMQKIIAKLITHESFGEASFQNSDVNHDGQVNMADVVLLQKFIAKLVASFEPTEG